MKFSILTLLLLLAAPLTLQAGPSTFDLVITVEMACGNSQSVYLYNLPNGGGSRFDEAQLEDGTLVDATLTVTLADGSGQPIANFPAEDIWLASLINGELVPCVGGVVADVDTDASGATFFQDPLMAGGYTESPCQVLINGGSWGLPPLPLFFNSGDINGDLYVNLQDVGLFTSVFYGPYHFKGDFFRDGTLNIADVGRMALGIGAACP